MAIKTYGNIRFDKSLNKWIIDRAQPHVCIKLKSVFAKIEKTATVPFTFHNTSETAADLVWFTERYPLQISSEDKDLLIQARDNYNQKLNEIEQILLPEYNPSPVSGFKQHSPRGYQLKANELLLKVDQLLLGDDLGLGKTVTGILGLLNPDSLPAAVVCQTHLSSHWVEQIAKFTDLKVHIVRTRKPYSLPTADVYVFAYSRLQGWVDIFEQGLFKYTIFDEAAELRHAGTEKYRSAQVLVAHAKQSLGLSATPVYNYGDEIFNILNLLKPGVPYRIIIFKTILPDIINGSMPTCK